MIHFDFDWSDLLNKLILGIALVILPLQLWMLVFRNRSRIDFSGRFALRFGLNILLWLSVLAFILQPYISTITSSKNRILAGKEVPTNFIEKIKDSLKVEQVTIANLKKSSADTLFVIGQSFEPSFFGDLKQLPNSSVIQWIFYHADNQVQSLQWKGILRKGEMQTVYGALQSSQKQTIKIQFGSQTLDSAVLHSGFNNFRLRFPAFAQGRSSVELILGNQTVDTLRFFASAGEKMTVRFLLDNPDFETRNLATWLGKNGHAVDYEVKLSKDLQSKQNINAAKDPDLIITDPGNASNTAVKKALNRGKSVLFINLNNPAAEIPNINTALATRFQVRKISNETSVKVSPELSALPYHFTKSANHLELPPYPVVVEKTKGKVGVSLLLETFPMQLTGDSIAYEKIWNAVLASVRPGFIDQVEVDAPVYLGLKTGIGTNASGDFDKKLLIGKDTIFTQKSALNPKSGLAEFLPMEPGWVTLQDSVPLDIYVKNSGSGLQNAQMADFVRSYSGYQTSIQDATKDGIGNHIDRKLPDWFWFVWLLICFTALWVEAKF